MKILIATGIFPPEIGGPATYSKVLAEELIKLGHEVVVITYGEAENLKSIIIYISRKWPRGLRHFVYFLRVFWFGRKSDIIYVQDTLSAGLPALLAAKILGKKFVLKIVGDYAWEQYRNKVQSSKLKVKSLDEFQNEKFDFITELRRKIQKFVAKNADKIIVPSFYLKELVKKWGIEENKIEVIYNAFEIPQIGISKKEAREKTGLNQEDKILISAGRLVPWKGFGTLIDIMPELAAKDHNVKLIIVGDGPEKKNLKSKILNLKIENRINDNILLVKSLLREELFLYLKAGDIFLLNTGYEGFSHQLLEVLAAGLPIITTPVCGNKELIKEVSGIVAAGYDNKEEWLEKLNKFLDNPQNFPKPEISQSFFKKFNKEEMIRKVEELFKKI